MRKNLTIALLISTVLTLHGNAQTPPATLNGKTLYVKHCTKCHGEDGTRGEWGAKNLRKSKLDPDDLFRKISRGGWIMPRWSKILNDQEIQAITGYVKTLRYQ